MTRHGLINLAAIQLAINTVEFNATITPDPPFPPIWSEVVAEEQPGGGPASRQIMANKVDVIAASLGRISPVIGTPASATPGLSPQSSF